jgi:tetratricopeptide (TPR) repeat protein
MYRVLAESTAPPSTPPLALPGRVLVSRAATYARAAWANEQAGETYRAISLYGRAVELLDEPDPPETHWQVTLPALNNLASLLRSEGRPADAEERYLKALHVLAREDRPLLRPVMALILRNLADLYHSQGLLTVAQEILILARAAADETERPADGLSSAWVPSARLSPDSLKYGPDLTATP